MPTSTTKKQHTLLSFAESKRIGLRQGHSMKALHAGSNTRSPIKVQLYNAQAPNFMALNKVAFRRKGSIARPDAQVSDFIVQEMLNETDVLGKSKVRHISLRRDTHVPKTIASEKYLGNYTKTRLVEGFDEQKNFLRNATRKPYEALKARMCDTLALGRVPRKSNCVRTVYSKIHHDDCSMLSVEDMTQSGIVVDEHDKQSPRKILTDNRDIRKREAVKPRPPVSINNLLQLIKSDRKLAQNRKAIELKLKDFKIKNTKKGTGEALRAEDVEQRLLDIGLGQIVRLTHLRNIDFLGQGTYAFVKLAADIKTQTHVAVKIFDKKTLVVRRRLENLAVR